MKMSARNCFRGTDEGIDEGVVAAKVRVRIESPITITAAVTKGAVKELDIQRGDSLCSHQVYERHGRERLKRLRIRGSVLW